MLNWGDTPPKLTDWELAVFLNLQTQAQGTIGIHPAPPPPKETSDPTTAEQQDTSNIIARNLNWTNTIDVYQEGTTHKSANRNKDGWRMGEDMEKRHRTHQQDPEETPQRGK